MKKLVVRVIRLDDDKMDELCEALCETYWYHSGRDQYGADLLRPIEGLKSYEWSEALSMLFGKSHDIGFNFEVCWENV